MYGRRPFRSNRYRAFFLGFDSRRNNKDVFRFFHVVTEDKHLSRDNRLCFTCTYPSVRLLLCSLSAHRYFVAIFAFLQSNDKNGLLVWQLTLRIRGDIFDG